MTQAAPSGESSSQQASISASSPPLPPLLGALGLLASLTASLAAQPTLLYDHGQPTEAEQYAVELINRARANPPAEGVFLSTVDRPDLNQAMAEAGVSRSSVLSNFNNYNVKQPLAIHTSLGGAARLQAQDQADHNYQGHSSPTGGTLATRVASAGYPPGETAELVLAGISDTYFAHVCLNIDWTIPNTPNRRAIMNLNGTPHYPLFREIGVGSVSATGSNVAPFVTTLVLGVQSANQPFLTGVAYRDHDLDGFYTPENNEPLAGVTVRPNVGDYYAVTSGSGGYSLPLRNLPPGTTQIVLTFSGGALSRPVQRIVALQGSANVKADLVLPGVPSCVITEVRHRATDLLLSHTSHSAYLYRVEFSDDLLAPWTLLAEDLPGTGQPMTITDPGAAGRTQRFYRVTQY